MKLMGCSNLHYHGQIWTQSLMLTQVEKTQNSLKAYFEKNNSNLLTDYLQEELKHKECIVVENDHFVALVPFWTIWTFETMIAPKRDVSKITGFFSVEILSYVSVLKLLTIKYDTIFETSFRIIRGCIRHQLIENYTRSDNFTCISIHGCCVRFL
jgi:UDPglucose--hexose-1-phosphate uridylyltransferase